MVNSGKIKNSLKTCAFDRIRLAVPRVSTGALYTIASILVCSLFAVLSPLTTDKKPRTSEEKTAEFSESSTNIVLKVGASIQDGGDSGFRPVKTLLHHDYAHTLIDSSESVPETGTVFLPADPRSCWHTDSSPPANIFT
jgi:hypothetical protein